MISIHVEDRDGQKRDIRFEENPSGNLMEVLVDEGFNVPAICGGMAGCATCHITFNTGFEKLPEQEEDEEFMLESLPNHTKTSRLSCQLALTEVLDGANVTVLGDGM